MKVALIGNPNCGKTTLFNLLTGAKQRVGNWPGVTVEQKMGIFDYQNIQYDIIDLPGTYSIETDPMSVSQDELITREFVLAQSDSVIINIIDATNLQRSLYLTFQLLDLQLPMILVLNMIDAVETMGEIINIDKLSQLLGCPIVAVSATKKIGLNLLYQQIEKIGKNKSIAMPSIDSLGNNQQTIITRYIDELPKDSVLRCFNRWQIIDALLDDSNYDLTDEEHEKLNACRLLLATWCDNEIDVALASARYDTIDLVCKKVIDKPRELSTSFTEKLDKFALGRITGIPFFLFVMYVMFIIAINFGSVFIDFFDIFCETIFVNGSAQLLQSLNAPNWLIIILAKGIGTGIQTVSTFIPVIGTMFFFLSFLEDSGYLARAAMVVDRGMRCIGLPGKAFVPMLLGFGCGVPAIMGTRTLESTRDRIMAICMIPFMSCGARLPVYALFAVIFFPHHASTVVFALYMLGIMVAIITGFVLKLTLLTGKITPFIMEMPVYRIPTLKSLLSLTWQRLKSFIFRAGKAIVVMITILSILNSWGKDGSFGHENSNNSVLSAVSQTMIPVFEPMGITKENWPATVGIFTGIFAKESVIATLNSLYSMSGNIDKNKNVSLSEGILNALGKIPENLVSLSDAVLDPLGLATVDENIDSLKLNLSIDSTAISQIKTSFVTSSAAMAYLIFILLYTPCAAALGAVYREAGLKWMTFVAIWTFVIGWIAATVYYQCTLLENSHSAIFWLTGCGGVMISMIIFMRLLGRYLPCKFNVIPKTTVNKKSTGCH
ncbi:ferrous iron transport protein B [Gilliamella sp. wkB18]|uniref:Fe(2+) transporter permease subunit FeoB n=1 Tax=Gilliamella sp. wkB18 TaxID=3120260 RepID=UPI0004DD0F70|nr:Fe(2+) transporter permease subunit FeoB [Gilliamella apicola]KFA58555.1 Ferrous iron transport protein B [Gilliamella apicola]OCG65356.1 ferrous iron transport protein B [Gilliamella apicola]